jgi:hypothetical protein
MCIPHGVVAQEVLLAGMYEKFSLNEHLVNLSISHMHRNLWHLLQSMKYMDKKQRTASTEYMRLYLKIS